MLRKLKFSLFKGAVTTMLLLLALVSAMSGLAYSQTANPTDSSAQMLTADQLDQITAPIALYPDELISHVLPASTVPLEIVQADRYVKDHGGKVSEMPDADWDPSVKALTLFPDVLAMMDKNLDWTETLGAAVINQQKDVMDSIQRLRRKNYDAGNLSNMDHQTAVVEEQTIKIVPSDPDVVYVPQYDSTTVVESNPGGLALAFAGGVMVADWFNYRTVDWYHNGFIVNPVYIDHYRYPPNSRYYGYYHNDIHRGYSDGGYWKPTPYSRDHYSQNIGNKTNIKFGNTNINIENKTNLGNKPMNHPSNYNAPNRKPEYTNHPDSMPSERHDIERDHSLNESPFGNMQSRSEVSRNSDRGSFSRGGGGGFRGGGGGRRR